MFGARQKLTNFKNIHVGIAMGDLAHESAQPAVIRACCQAILVERKHKVALVHVLEHTRALTNDLHQVVADYLDEADIVTPFVP
jgi:hypothetical protein